MTFKTSLDKKTKTITIGLTILFALIFGVQCVIIIYEGSKLTYYTTVACLLIYFVAFAFRPINYVVTKDYLIVHRFIFNISIKRADITSVESVENNKILGTFRTFGVGGLFGYYGYFTNFSMGRMTWFATRNDKLVLVNTLDKQKFIFTPDEPDQFIKELTTQA